MNDRQSAALEHVGSLTEPMRRDWAREKPFPYLVADDFLPVEFAEAILAAYPPPDVPGWQSKTYNHQRNKAMRRSGFPPPIADYFALVNSKEFLGIVSRVTGIEDTIA